jgi:hypothetical protein
VRAIREYRPRHIMTVNYADPSIATMSR